MAGRGRIGAWWACAVLVACAAAAAWSASAGVSGWLDPFWTKLEGTHAALVKQHEDLLLQVEEDPRYAGQLRENEKATRVVEQVMASLQVPEASTSYAGEIRAVVGMRARFWSFLSGSFGGNLHDLDTAGSQYFTDTLAAGIRYAEEIPSLPEGDRPAAIRSHARAWKLLEGLDWGKRNWSRLASAADIVQPVPGEANDWWLNATPMGLAVDSTGRYVYELGLEGTIRQFAFQADGSLQYLVPGSFPIWGSPAGWQLSMIAHPTRGFVYVADGAGGTIAQYGVSSSGALEPLVPAEAAFLPGGTQPPLLLADPAGRFLYAAWRHEYANSESVLHVYEVGADGALLLRGTMNLQGELLVLSGPPTAGGRRFLFAHTRGYPQDFIHSIEVAEDGTLAPVGALDLNTPDAYLLDWKPLLYAPSGDLLYAVVWPGIGDTLLRPYAIGADGTLSPVGEGLPWGNPKKGQWLPSHLAADPAGRFVYGAGDQVVGSYRVDENGSLVTLTRYVDRSLQVDWRWGDCVVTPDGTQVLVTGPVAMGAPGDLVRRFAVGKTGKLRALR